ncbi:Ras-related protein Rab-11A [Ceratobasidium theobromae]|uniref:Ras-related protein Rab-11A n=1 Tax=Ceratobasidium theobromae TaxID=1582974 RepID=A0A5N5QKT2_9AGAM|nr:Ras-related protein Rab-11A [Ceratobasidium theobromae]
MTRRKLQANPDSDIGISLVNGTQVEKYIAPFMAMFAKLPKQHDLSHNSNAARVTLTMSYSPVGRETSPHTVLIPWTNKYEVALASAKSAFQRYFPNGPVDQHRWLATRIQTSSGVTWAEIMPELFGHVVGDHNNELWLCEDNSRIMVLPIGHEEKQAYRFKFITVGESGVGKTMMIQCFTTPAEARFPKGPTVQARMDMTSRLITANGERVKIELWDTAGTERYRSLLNNYYRGTDGVILVYSVANRDTFNQCRGWLAELRRNLGELVPVMLIGNQIDLKEERAVEADEAQVFAINHKLLFAEVSAKQGINVDHVFQMLAGRPNGSHHPLKVQDVVADLAKTTAQLIETWSLGLGYGADPSRCVS